MVGEASGRMQKADCRDEIALPAAMLAWLKYRKQRTRNSRKRFLVFFCSLFVKARVVYRLRLGAVPSSFIYFPKKEKTGDFLISQAASRQVSSALESLTSVFGMGTGVSSLL